MLSGLGCLAIIVLATHHDAADVVRDYVDAGNRVGHDQFIRNLLLRTNDDADFDLDGDQRHAERLP